MTVSIFCDPELIVTNLTPYLPAETDALIISNTCSMRDAAFDYAYTQGISLTEIATDILFDHTMQRNVATVLQRLLARSEHIVLFAQIFRKSLNAPFNIAMHTVFLLLFFRFRKHKISLGASTVYLPKQHNKQRKHR